MLIKPSELTAEALQGIVEAYILQNLHTDDGEYDLQRWVETVTQQVKNGQLVIEWSEVNQSVTLKSAQDLNGVDFQSWE